MEKWNIYTVVWHTVCPDRIVEEEIEGKQNIFCNHPDMPFDILCRESHCPIKVKEE